jgi:hypothetical protein
MFKIIAHRITLIFLWGGSGCKTGFTSCCKKFAVHRVKFVSGRCEFMQIFTRVYEFAYFVVSARSSELIHGILITVSMCCDLLYNQGPVISLIFCLGELLHGSTSCARQREYSTLMRDVYKICRRVSAGSCQSGDRILHRELPYIKIVGKRRTTKGKDLNYHLEG